MVQLMPYLWAALVVGIALVAFWSYRSVMYVGGTSRREKVIGKIGALMAGGSALGLVLIGVLS